VGYVQNSRSGCTYKSSFLDCNGNAGWDPEKIAHRYPLMFNNWLVMTKVSNFGGPAVSPPLLKTFLFPRGSHVSEFFLQEAINKFQDML